MTVSVTDRSPLACRVLGHRWRFTAEGRVMRWDCERCGVPGGSKNYGDARAAKRYASAFDSESERGERRFLLGAAPLWLARRLRRRAR